MRRTGALVMVAFFPWLLDSSAGAARGDFTFRTLASFVNNTGAPNSDLTLDSQGNLYGTTYGGNVYKVNPTTGTITELASFGTQAGTYGGVSIDSQGNLYGTTYAGGAYGYGSVFEVAVGTGTVSTIVSFGNNSLGIRPFGGVSVDSAGNIYGTTAGGANDGTPNDGTVFKIAAGTSNLTYITAFGQYYGSFPTSNLTFDAQGNIYGTTMSQGPNGSGGTDGNQTVYKIAAGGGTVTTLASFNGSNTGDNLYNSTVTFDAHGNLYGTTSTGGAYGDGSVFEIAAGTGAVTTLASFTGAN